MRESLNAKIAKGRRERERGEMAEKVGWGWGRWFRVFLTSDLRPKPIRKEWAG